MKYLSNINWTGNCWNQFGIEYAVRDVFTYLCFLVLFLMEPTTENLWISKLATREKKDPKHTHQKKIWTHKIHTRRNFAATKYSRKKNFGPTKYTREIIFDPRTNHKKKFRTHEIPPKARWHDDTRSTRPTMARDPLNLAYSNITYINTVLGITN